MTDNIVIQNEEIISVGELNKSAKYLLENTFNNVSVLGEISNLSRPSSGHIYFTLKDSDGAIRCAMFRNQNIKLDISGDISFNQAYIDTTYGYPYMGIHIRIAIYGYASMDIQT